MDLDLTNQDDVVTYMKSSKNSEDWNCRCDQVKDANGGDYPGFWFAAVILSGVFTDCKSKW